MPELKCTVQTCVHNQQFLCNLDKIEEAETKQSAQRRLAATAFRKEKETVIPM